MSNQVTKVQATKTLLERPEVKQKFVEMLGSKAAGFTTSVLSAMNQNEMLKNADPTSVYMCALMAASVDLPINPNLGFAYIIPYNSKDGMKAQFQIGYKGLRQLALRTGEFIRMNESDVKEGEIVNHDRLTGEITFEWIQDYNERAKAKTIGYVSFFELNNGFQSTFYMSLEQLNEHGNRYSQSFKRGYGVWKDNFDAMAKKTVSKLNLSKNAPLSVEVIHKAIEADQGVINDVETMDIDYVDNDSEAAEEPKRKPNKNTMAKIKEGLELGTVTMEQVEMEFNLSEDQKNELNG